MCTQMNSSQWESGHSSKLVISVTLHSVMQHLQELRFALCYNFLVLKNRDTAQESRP